MSQLEIIKQQATHLSLSELAEASAFLQELQRQTQKRQNVQRVFGKYRDRMRSSDEFMKDKAAEKAREEKLCGE